MLDNRPSSTTNGASPGPLVSIIIPCYNSREFISDAIESALAQTHRNIEVIVVDDGSTDGSQAIVQSYPVCFVREKHQGVSATRNRGISESHGEFLVFLDSDDRLLPEAIAVGIAALEQNPLCEMTVGAHNFITHSGQWLATKYKPASIRGGYELLLISNFIECTSSALFRRQCFSDGIGFRSRFNGAEDYDVYLRVARRGKPVHCHNQVVAEYRIHSSNSSRNSSIMLSHTLAVHSEQWPFVRRSLRRILAYLYGFFFWRRKYGRQLTMELITSGQEWTPQANRTALRLLARSYPQGLLLVLVSRMLPRNITSFISRRA